MTNKDALEDFLKAHNNDTTATAAWWAAIRWEREQCIAVLQQAANRTVSDTHRASLARAIGHIKERDQYDKQDRE